MVGQKSDHFTKGFNVDLQPVFQHNRGALYCDTCYKIADKVINIKSTMPQYQQFEDEGHDSVDSELSGIFGLNCSIMDSPRPLTSAKTPEATSSKRTHGVTPASGKRPAKKQTVEVDEHSYGRRRTYKEEATSAVSEKSHLFTSSDKSSSTSLVINKDTSVEKAVDSILDDEQLFSELKRWLILDIDQRCEEMSSLTPPGPSVLRAEKSVHHLLVTDLISKVVCELRSTNPFLFQYHIINKIFTNSNKNI